MDQAVLTPHKQEKSLHFELMRLTAIFFVVFTHTGDHGFFLFAQYPDTHMLFWVYLFVSIFGSFAVPLFFAVSGALMLNRPQEPMKQLWTKRVLRYAILLVSVCFLYYLQANGFDPREINPKEFIIILYSYCSGSITWFLYSYLAYLILLPILRVLAQNLKNEHFYYLFAIALFYQGIIPVLEYVAFQGNQTLNPFFTVGWIAENIVLYPLLGYFLEHRLQGNISKKGMAILWAANVLTILLCCAMTVYRGRIMGEYSENTSEYFFSSFVLLNCAAMYLLLLRAGKKAALPRRLKKLIFSAGQCTLGIYAFHFFLMELPVSQQLRITLVSTGMNGMLASVLFCLYTILVCWGMTCLLRKIPFVKKIL